jgi:hypothetical protein
MGRTYLSVKLAIGFAIAFALVVAASEQSATPSWGAARPESESLVPGDGQRTEPVIVCDRGSGAARLTSLEVALTPPEVLDKLPMWHGTKRRDCAPRTT